MCMLLELVSSKYSTNCGVISQVLELVVKIMIAQSLVSFV